MTRSSALIRDPLDLAFLFNFFNAFPDQAGALSHIRKACCEGSRLVIFDYTRPSGAELPTAKLPVFATDRLRGAGCVVDSRLLPVCRKASNPTVEEHVQLNFDRSEAGIPRNVPDYLLRPVPRRSEWHGALAAPCGAGKPRPSLIVQIFPLAVTSR
jgi:SAM-dependent methyltransferase